MKTFHKITCPACAHSFTFKEVKEKVKLGMIHKFVNLVIAITLFGLLIFILVAAGRGMLPDESGVGRGFLPTLWGQVTWVFRGL